MTSTKTQLKLGLLVLGAIAAVAAVAAGLGLRSRQPTVRYHTYFDESVAGLDVGSTVDYRGVRIGSVGDISIAPDRRRIDVALDITKPEATALGLPELATTLRAVLSTSGITGVKFVDLGRSDNISVPPELAFTPDARYIPARASFLSSLEAQVANLGERVPLFLASATNAVSKLEQLLDRFDRERVTARLATAIDNIDATFADVRHFVHSVDRSRLPERLAQLLGNLDAAAAKLHGIAAKVEGDGELEETMRDVGTAARTFREFVQELEREPDMLVKGRARSDRP
jgi:ABC-type transporter Mla subunit MlaD